MAIALGEPPGFGASVPSGAPCSPALCLLSGEGINPLHLFPPQSPSLPGPVSLKLVASLCPKPILTRVRVRGTGMVALCGRHKRGGKELGWGGLGAVGSTGVGFLWLYALKILAAEPSHLCWMCEMQFFFEG